MNLTIGTISILLVILGAGIMLLAILETQRLLQALKDNQVSRNWRFLFYLMVFFIFGYAGVAVLIGMNIPAVIILLMGLIFFFGSWFVLIVVQTSTKTIQELHQISKQQLALQKEKDITEAIANLKSEFLGIMSHELRTPLNAIIGFSQVLEFHLTDAESLKFNQKIYDSGNHLLRLIDYVLEYASLENNSISLNIGSFLVENLLKDIYQKYIGTAKSSNLELKIWTLQQEPLSIDNDYFHIFRVLEHLLSNAIKFTKCGNIVLAYTANKDNILLMIQDSGIGVNPEHIPRLFKPFSQGDSSSTRQYAGIGLGLMLCKRLIEAMGGIIWLESHGIQAGTHPDAALCNLRNELLDNPQALSQNTGTIVFCSLPISII